MAVTVYLIPFLVTVEGIFSVPSSVLEYDVSVTVFPSALTVYTRPLRSIV